MSSVIPTLMLCGLAISLPAQAAVSLVVDKATQQARDADRRHILTTELEAEQGDLAAAEKALAANPSDVQRAAVHRHLENVKALQRELNPALRATAQPASIAARAVRPAKRTTASTPFWSVYQPAASTDELDVYQRQAATTNLPTTPERKETP